MKLNLHTAPILVSLLILSDISVAFADCPPQCSLSELQKLSLQYGPEISKAEAEVSWNQAQFDEARFAALDFASFDMKVAPTAQRLGDIAHYDQPDISFSRQMGLLVSFTAEATLPLTPISRIISGTRGAKQKLRMSEQEVELEKIQQLQAVESAYRQAQVAKKSQELIRKGRRYVIRALRSVERLIEEDLSGADETDRLHLVMLRANFDARLSAVSASRRISLARLRSFAGLPKRTRLDLDELENHDFELEPLDWYLESALRNRPEVELSSAGIRAAESWVKFRQFEMIPDIVIGVYYGFRNAPVVDDQKNAFVIDYWNGRGPGFGLLFRWSPVPGFALSRVRRAQGDLDYARAKRRFALSGIAYQVETAYIEALEFEELFKARQRSQRLSESRFLKLLADHRRGEVSATDIPGAAQDWVNQEITAIQALSRLLRARSELERASGMSKN